MIWRDVPPSHDPRQECLKAVHQSGLEGRLAIIVQLDPNGSGVQVVQAKPFPRPCMPCALSFADQLRNFPCFTDHVMG